MSSPLPEGSIEVSSSSSQMEALTIPPQVERPVGYTALDGFTILNAIENDQSPTRLALQEQIIGQPDAIDAIVDSLDRSAIRPSDDNRPVATLAFLGPTGVGKSETAKALAEINGNGTAKLLTVDCSNFSNGHEVANLTGSPVGYIGHNQTPFFTKAKVEQPGVVVLFDEIEKGSSELYNLMLQIMGDGRLVLSDGDEVSFRDATIILTSNLGAKEMAARLSKTPIGFGGNSTTRDTSKAGLEKVALGEFKKFFAPEFVNRLQKMVVFQPLDQENLREILQIKIDQANDTYEEKFGARISLSDATAQHLVEIAQREPELGARPLVRALEDNIQTMLGRYIKSGNIPDGSQIRVFHATELPDAAQTTEQVLVFAVKPDKLLRRPQQVLAITQGTPDPIGND